MKLKKETDSFKRILVIDDDAGMVKLLETRLTAHGYHVMSANDAATGLEMAIKQSPSLIILDVMMPIINGYNICRMLKTEEKLTTPIIMVTARVKDEDKKIGKEVGADAYLTKPINMEELLAKVKEYIKEEQPAA